MNKILLVYEDYADLMAVEGALKKVGFDVIGLSSEYSVTEQVLAFNPDLVVGAGRGGKVSSLGVGKRLKEMHRWQGRSILIFPANFKPNPQDLIRIRVDMVLEAPVPPVRLIQVIGKLLGHDEALLLERLNKAIHIENAAKSGAAGSSASSGGKFSLDGEAIYVKGSVSDSNDPEGRSLRSERINEEGHEFELNNEEQEEKPKISFRFGDRISESHAESEKVASSAEEGFADVDLKALERELLGGGVPEVERIEAISEPEPESTSTTVPVSPVKAEESSVVAATSEDAAKAVTVAGGDEDNLASIQSRAQEELKKSAVGLKERMAKASNMVADVKVSPKSTVTRVEARRRQAQLAAEWDPENLKELDKLRREFTKALFKK